MQHDSLITFLLWGQGAYFALTGLWPVLHYASFEKITGPKTDVWLVKTVGALVTVVAAILLRAAWYNDVHPDTVVAGMGAAFVLLMVDIIYVSKKVIRPVYLADALIELILAGLWAFTFI